MASSPIESLKAGIAELLSRYEKLSRENAELRRELEGAHEAIDEQQNRIEDLKKRIDRLQLDLAFSNASPDRAEAKRKVSKMLKQIDQCIALLDD
ncbi:MAG: hypothetical protein IJK20_04750 [Bacteroidales bacterium]|nr:hypothetical protein [Bacteroidales bacterium]